METPSSPTFADLLRRYRHAARLTQEELAERAGLSSRGVLYLERGARQPYRDTVRRLSDALALSEEERATLVALARQPRRPDSRPAAPSPPDGYQELTDRPWIYIAHVQQDSILVERLHADLRRHDIIPWIDEHDLVPGTPSWEQALRDAIRGASALVLVASPATRASRSIGDELRIAELYGRRVYPLWVSGEQWIECIPLGWGGFPYLDARGSRYAAALTVPTAELRHPSLGPAPPAPGVTPRNPYKGLRSFTAEDTSDFFGRDALVAALLAALPVEPERAPRFLALVGASGSGKSSVVRAGLLPRLQAGALSGSAQWVYLTPLVPGTHPLDALARSLAEAMPASDPAAIHAALSASPQALDALTRRLVAPAGQRVVLVIDQCEELFAAACREEERQWCIDLLVMAASTLGGPTLVILTLRADVYDRPLSYPAFGALLHAHSLVTLPPSVTDLRQAIQGPAALPDVQLSFDDDLVGDMLFDLRGQSGALPLLQFTLDQLFARRAGSHLTGAAYRALGGVRGALAHHAEATYAALSSEEHRRLARALFLRLIDPGATEQETTRRRAAVAEFVLPDPEQSARLRAVIDAFIAARLLVVSRGEVTGAGTPRTTIEVSHEALIREWARLGGWLREAREDVRLQQSLSADAAVWEQHNRQGDHLYRGTELAAAEAWAGRNMPSALEVTFVQAALDERQRQDVAERERQARELAVVRQAATRLRLLVIVLALFLVGAAGLSTLALTTAHQATAARQQALSRQLAAQAVTRLTTQYDLALLLSLEARRMADTVEARASLLQGLEEAPPGLLALLSGHTLGVNSVAMSRDGSLLASGSEDGTIRLWDMRRRRAVGAPMVAHAGPIWGVAFSPNGTVLASGDDDGTVRLWDVATQRPLGPPVRAHTGPSTPLAFSPDGTMLASAGDDGNIAIWAVSPHGALMRPTSVSGCSAGAQSWALAISPSGNELANGCTDGTIAVWRVSGTTLTLLGTTNAGATVFGVAFSPDGTMLASAGSDHTVRLWDVAGLEQRGQPLTGHTDVVFSVAFSPDGKTLASGSLDGTVRLWDVQRHQSLGQPLVSHTGDMNSVVFSPDGSTLAAGTADGSVALWDVQHPQTLTSTLNVGETNGIVVSPDGTMVAPLDSSGNVDLWDLTGGTPRHRSVIAVTDATDVTFSPDGRTVAVGEQDGTVQLWDVASGLSLSVPIVVRGGSVDAVAVSPDGAIVATGSQDGAIQLWSVAGQPRRTLRPLGAPLVGHTAAVQGLAFSPDGKTLASGGADRRIRLWDVAQHRLLGPPLVGNVAGVDAVTFSPNGRLLASAGSDRTVRLWDVATRRPRGPPLIGHTDDAGSVAFNPDGTLLASGSSDHTVRLWDVASGQPLGAPLSTGHDGFVASVAFTADGKTLIAANTDGAVRQWTIDLSTWPQRACHIANRNLTRQEWQQYLGILPYQKTCPDLPAGP